MKQAAQVLIVGSQVDPQERSLFTLAYDSQKDESMFAGEAMQKSENYLQVRTNRFLATCNVFIECLNVHKQVADLTQEQVDAMNPETRKIYDNIKSSKESINTIINDVIGYIFRGYKGEKEKMQSIGQVFGPACCVAEYEHHNIVRQGMQIIKLLLNY